jgi:hypothetical protein
MSEPENGMRWWRIVTFVPALILIVRYTYFDRFDKRGHPGVFFLCILLALLVTGAVDWLVVRFVL